MYLSTESSSENDEGAPHRAARVLAACAHESGHGLPSQCRRIKPPRLPCCLPSSISSTHDEPKKCAAFRSSGRGVTRKTRKLEPAATLQSIRNTSPMNAVMQVAAQAVCTLRAVGAIVLRPSGSQSGEARARREEVRPMQREVKRIIFQVVSFGLPQICLRNSS